MLDQRAKEIWYYKSMINNVSTLTMLSFLQLVLTHLCFFFFTVDHKAVLKQQENELFFYLSN